VRSSFWVHFYELQNLVDWYFYPFIDPHVSGENDVEPAEPDELACVGAHCPQCGEVLGNPRNQDTLWHDLRLGIETECEVDGTEDLVELCIQEWVYAVLVEAEF